jgi:hypothetical protein
MVFFSALLLAAPALAQAPEPCMQADALDASLIDWYGEHAVQESRDGQLVLWMNRLSGTWTLVEYSQSGLACVINHGTEPELHDQRGQLMAQLKD